LAGFAIPEKGFFHIMTRMVATGAATHYAELAAELDCGIEDGRGIVREIMATGFPEQLERMADARVRW